MKSRIATFVGLWLAAFTACGQGNFQNLDFEAAQVVYESNGEISAAAALPGWTASSGANQLLTIPRNELSYNPPVQLMYGSHHGVIGGTFSVSVNGDGSMSQTGWVPKRGRR